MGFLKDDDITFTGNPKTLAPAANKGTSRRDQTYVISTQGYDAGIGTSTGAIIAELAMYGGQCFPLTFKNMPKSK